MNNSSNNNNANDNYADIWLAPAKINLFLRIVAQRADGYHELQTLFQLLDKGDRLQFFPNKTGKIRRITDIPSVAEQDDIIVKAARLLQFSGDRTAGVDIHIEKILPMGGGLGGGSSDAATTLIALNFLWGLHMPQSRLLPLALQLGADVPVFVAGHSAWAEGVGEQLISVDLPRQWYIIVTPKVEIPTAALFSSPQLTRDARPIRIRDYFGLAPAGGSMASRVLLNDRPVAEIEKNAFEPVVRAMYPQVATALDWLSKQSGQKARLSGTGASIFAAFEDEQLAINVAEKIPCDWRYFIARAINESPAVARVNG